MSIELVNDNSDQVKNVGIVLPILSDTEVLQDKALALFEVLSEELNEVRRLESCGAGTLEGTILSREVMDLIKRECKHQLHVRPTISMADSQFACNLDSLVNDLLRVSLMIDV